MKKYSLESVGVKGFAYPKDVAIKIAYNYNQSNTPILGGDVYIFENDQISITDDNWYCDQMDNETLLDYANRSYQVTIDYIHKLPENTRLLFHFVIEENRE